MKQDKNNYQEKKSNQDKDNRNPQKSHDHEKKQGGNCTF